MQTKKILIGVLAVALLAGGAFAYSNGDLLQGKFGGFKSTSSKTTTSTVLTVTGSDTGNLVDLSEIDFTNADSTWFTVGKFTTSFSSGVSACGDIRLVMNDGSSTYQYQNWLDDMFQDVRLQYRTSAGTFVGYVEATPGTDLSQFDPSDVGASGNGYFLIEVQAKEDAVTTDFNKDLPIFVSGICAEKNGTKYYWLYDDNMSQNSYFKMTADNALGLTVGSVKVQD